MRIDYGDDDGTEDMYDEFACSRTRKERERKGIDDTCIPSELSLILSFFNFEDFNWKQQHDPPQHQHNI
jgi:hypothetical protein